MSPTNVGGWGRRMPGQGRCRRPSRCLGQDADLINQTRPIAHSIVPDRRVVLSHAESLVRIAQYLDDFGGRHAGLDDLLALADDVWSLTTVSANGSADANTDASTASTAKTTDADGPARAARERDE